MGFPGPKKSRASSRDGTWHGSYCCHASERGEAECAECREVSKLFECFVKRGWKMTQCPVNKLTLLAARRLVLLELEWFNKIFLKGKR